MPVGLAAAQVQGLVRVVPWAKHGSLITWCNDSLCTCVYEKFYVREKKNQTHSELFICEQRNQNMKFRLKQYEFREYKLRANKAVIGQPWNSITMAIRLNTFIKFRKKKKNTKPEDELQ